MAKVRKKSCAPRRTRMKGVSSGRRGVQVLIDRRPRKPDYLGHCQTGKKPFSKFERRFLQPTNGKNVQGMYKNGVYNKKGLPEIPVNPCSYWCRDPELNWGHGDFQS